MVTVSVDTGHCLRQEFLLAVKSPRLTGTEAMWESSVSSFPLTLEMPGLRMNTTNYSFTRILEIQTQVLRLARQALYPLSHLPG